MTETVPAQGADLARRRKIALVADHLEDVLDLIEIALERADFSVLRASSADEALELFQENASEVDLLLTDMRLGTESGLELAQQLLREKPSLKILITSTYAVDRRLVSAKSKVDFLAKPFSASELKKKIDLVF